MEKIKISWEKGKYRLQSFEKGQAKKYYQDCFGKIDKEVNRLTGTLEEFDYETIIQYYNRIIDDKNRYDFMIIDPAGKFIGESVINEIDWQTKSANFRIVIFDSQNCSKGIGTWVVKKTRDFAFEMLKLHRLELDVFSFNHRAQRVYEKAGFQVEGVRKDAIMDGKQYADDIIMAILEDEWRNIKENEKL
ncbi:GNAT family N-acetyltransferase [Longibaculum muris]|uniref:GNAT family N-acetyltransferase n=1 Tax=Longibaculum muris TaxID=1796628 RepID=UPI0012B9C059|nr:GNAT family protein [Longibaculum muris]